jgi:hypothetical protein
MVLQGNSVAVLEIFPWHSSAAVLFDAFLLDWRKNVSQLLLHPTSLQIDGQNM